MVPAVPLFAYQQRWVDDDSRLKIYAKSRQVGITWAETLDIVLRLMAERRKWYYLSISEDRAAEAIEYAIAHCLALGVRAQFETTWPSFEGVQYKQLSIEFPNKSKLIGLSANPRTARGCSGNLTLDEHGHHQQSEEIWRAVSALSTWGYSIRVISTPNGQQGNYHRIWTNNHEWDCDAIEHGLREGRDPAGDRWSRHLTNIYDAKADGHPVDVDVAREIAGTEGDWQQEYLCKFLDEAHAWLPYKLIESAYDIGATLDFDHTQRPVNGSLGVDIGRKRDLFVCWLNERRGSVDWTRGVITRKGADFDEMTQIVFDLMPMVRSACLDKVGIGAQLAESTEKKWPHKAEGVNFTAENSAKLAALVQGAFVSQRIKIPESVEVRRDLHSVRRVYTDAGNVRYEAPRTKHGHADRFWALGLSIMAANNAPGSIDDARFGDSRRSYGSSRKLYP